MLSKIKFHEEWDEICPIFRKINNYKEYEQIGTGVLINILDNVYLFTAAHVIDWIYEYDDELFIPTKNTFYAIDGELFHNPLVYSDKVQNPSEHRKSDNIDFSYYKLSSSFVLKLTNQYIPLKENQLDLSSNFNLDSSFAGYPYTRTSHVRKHIKEEKLKEFTNEKIDQMDNIKLDITITFVGYPLRKTKYFNNKFRTEIVYYHGISMTSDYYISCQYNKDINILAQFGKYGTSNSDYEFKNSPKPEGISGGGVYKLIRTDNGFDRKLIGIGHQFKDKEHLFIGTNINYCLNLIKENQLMPYEVYQRLMSRTKIFAEMDNLSKNITL